MKFKFETLLTERHVVVKDDFNRTHGWNEHREKYYSLSSKIACADLGWNLNLMTRLAFSNLYHFTAKLDWLQYWDKSWSF